MADLTQADNICAICKSVYTFPRILDCFHIFCTPCLEQLLKNKPIFSCPPCRTVLPTKHIANFELYPFQDILENDGKTDDEPSCEMCEAIGIYSRKQSSILGNVYTDLHIAQILSACVKSAISIH
jgi:hypothetical protein